MSGGDDKNTGGVRVPPGGPTQEIALASLPEQQAGSDQAVTDATMMDQPMDLDVHLHAAEPAHLDERVQNLLGRKLSIYYGSLVAEPVPDQFVELLRLLGQKEKAK